MLMVCELFDPKRAGNCCECNAATELGNSHAIDVLLAAKSNDLHFVGRSLKAPRCGRVRGSAPTQASRVDQQERRSGPARAERHTRVFVISLNRQKVNGTGESAPAVHLKGHPAKLPDGLFAVMNRADVSGMASTGPGFLRGSVGPPSRTAATKRRIMRKKICVTALLGAVATSIVAFEAQSFPVSNLASQTSEVIQVRQGCGLGRHRGPWGGCRWNRGGGCWWRETPWGPRRVCRW
jgi:hypothetical protein